MLVIPKLVCYFWFLLFLFVCKFVIVCLCVHPSIHPKIYSFHPSVLKIQLRDLPRLLCKTALFLFEVVTLQVYNVSVDADAFLDIDGYSMESAEESCPPLNSDVASRPQLERFACKLASILFYIEVCVKCIQRCQTLNFSIRQQGRRAKDLSVIHFLCVLDKKGLDSLASL